MEKETLIKVLMCESDQYELETIHADSSSCFSPHVAATVLCSLNSKEDVECWISRVERATNMKFQVARTKVPKSSGQAENILKV